MSDALVAYWRAVGRNRNCRRFCASADISAHEIRVHGLRSAGRRPSWLTRIRENLEQTARSELPKSAASQRSSRWARGSRPRPCACLEEPETNRTMKVEPARQRGDRSAGRSASSFPTRRFREGSTEMNSCGATTFSRRPWNRLRNRVVDFECRGPYCQRCRRRRYLWVNCGPAMSASCRGVRSHIVRSA